MIVVAFSIPLLIHELTSVALNIMELTSVNYDGRTMPSLGVSCLRNGVWSRVGYHRLVAAAVTDGVHTVLAVYISHTMHIAGVITIAGIAKIVHLGTDVCTIRDNLRHTSIIVIDFNDLPMRIGVGGAWYKDQAKAHP